jgi:hypothetical protein
MSIRSLKVPDDVLRDMKKSNSYKYQQDLFKVRVYILYNSINTPTLAENPLKKINFQVKIQILIQYFFNYYTYIGKSCIKIQDHKLICVYVFHLDTSFIEC